MRVLAGLATSVLGTSAVLALLVVMNGFGADPPAPPPKAPTALEVVAPPPSRPKPRPRPQPRKTPPRRADLAPPTLAAAVGGLDLGLLGGAGLDLGAGAASLLGDDAVTTMTADAVDSLPTPTRQSPATYPARARAKGLTGHVVLALDIDARGRLTDARVVSAEPPGEFDDAALQTVRRWAFAPATYQGRPVAVSDVELRVDFDLERR